MVSRNPKCLFRLPLPLWGEGWGEGYRFPSKTLPLTPDPSPQSGRGERIQALPSKTRVAASRFYFLIFSHPSSTVTGAGGATSVLIVSSFVVSIRWMFFCPSRNSSGGSKSSNTRVP
jgi:hypothetical protein